MSNSDTVIYQWRASAHERDVLRKVGNGNVSKGQRIVWTALLLSNSDLPDPAETADSDSSALWPELTELREELRILRKQIAKDKENKALLNRRDEVRTKLKRVQKRLNKIWRSRSQDRCSDAVADSSGFNTAFRPGKLAGLIENRLLKNNSTIKKEMSGAIRCLADDTVLSDTRFRDFIEGVARLMGGTDSDLSEAVDGLWRLRAVC